MGVDYTLSFNSLSGNIGIFSLTLDTTGYNKRSGAYLDSVDIKAWNAGSSSMSFKLLSAPDGPDSGTSGTNDWYGTEGPISSGPASNTGCKSSGAGFVCVEAITKGLFSVSRGDPYTFTFQVTASGFLTDPYGAHVGAGYADKFGTGASYGITSVTLVPEPQIYATLMAGLGLIGFVARRRRNRR
jgi:hypothetical protein